MNYNINYNILINHRRKRVTDFMLPKFIMLCGKKTSPKDNREITEKILSQDRSDIFVIYAEKILEKIDIKSEIDSLKFEELLVEISDGVILFLESYGSACELGAFTYIDNLAKKILVFENDVHKDELSFINTGPIRKIERLTKGLFDCGSVIYTKFLENGTIDFMKNRKKINGFIQNKNINLVKENISISLERKLIEIKPQILLLFLFKPLKQSVGDK